MRNPAMRMSNPAIRRMVRRAERGALTADGPTASYGGIMAKSVFFAALTLLSALGAVLAVRFALSNENPNYIMVLLIAAGVSFVAMLVFSLIIAFAPNTVKVLGTLYSVMQGFLLGLVSFLIDVLYEGVALAAIMGTVVVFILTLLLNKALGVRIGNKIWRAITIGFISLFVVQLVLMIASLFMDPEMSFMAHFWVQLAVSALCIVYASVMVLWNLQATEELVQLGVGKKYEWSLSFSLVTTLVYLYVELLELLVRLVMLFGRRER